MYIAEIICADGKRNTVSLTEEYCGDHVRVTLKKEQVPTDFSAVRVLSGLYTAQAGEDGYFVSTYANGTFLAYFKERENTDFTWTTAYLPFCGMVKNGKAYMAIVDGMRDGADFNITVSDHAYALTVLLRREHSAVYEDLTIELYELPQGEADYSAMARCYRRRQLASGVSRPLAEKAGERPLLHEMAHMPEIRIRLAWKPVPSPVKEQTPENEPPMHVACTFAQVENLIAELQRQGVRSAQICLVGWNISGHDGRYPQVFPVEPKLGGEEGLRHLIHTAQAAGYRIVCHTNSTDCYHISEDWNETIVLKKSDGRLAGNAEWSGGKMYEMCPVYGEKFAHRDLPRVRALGFEGAHYIDVISTVAPRECNDPDHAVTCGECAKTWRRILRYGKEVFGGISSEGTYDYAVNELDFGLYAAFHLISNRPSISDETIPLFPLVYHGIVLYNPSAETVNFPVKPRLNQLKFYEYGGCPAIYYYANFHQKHHWMGTDDFLMDTPEQLRETVGLIRAEMVRYETVADLQYTFMEHHEKVTDGLFRITYANGVQMLVNYNEKPMRCGAVTVPPQDFIVLR